VQNKTRNINWIVCGLGIDECDIHIDKHSGKDFDRPQAKL